MSSHHYLVILEKRNDSGEVVKICTYVILKFWEVLTKFCQPFKTNKKEMTKITIYTGCPRIASPEKKGSIWVNVII
jgi:hypothetical protein